jgi:hypothetical protein
MRVCQSLDEADSNFIEQIFSAYFNVENIDDFLKKHDEQFSSYLYTSRQGLVSRDFNEFRNTCLRLLTEKNLKDFFDNKILTKI